MRPIIPKLLLPAICMVITLHSYAQTCTGSLGDPVINQNFGSGTGQGAALANGITNLTYSASNCPNDGEYTISNNLSGINNCHSTWQNVTSDHTGNPNGYMMIVNASAQPNIFFTQTANGLCPNTYYEFSAYILNLITLAASGPGVSEPNIVFSIETTSGQVLASDTTGTIASTNGPQWNKYALPFTTPANITDIVVKMTNIAPGGNGNDLILDDITFRACGPIIQSSFTNYNSQPSVQLCQGSSAVYVMQAIVTGASSPVYQWQSNTNNNGWVDIAGQNTNTLTLPVNNAVTGLYLYRLGVANGSNISSVSCRVYSTPLTLSVVDLPTVPPIPPQSICQGSTLTLTASGGVSYLWYPPGGATSSTANPLIITNASAANSGNYIVKVIGANGCVAAPIQVNVSVMPQVKATISNDVTVCAGDPVQLKATGGINYKWTPSTGLSRDNIANPIALPLQTTTYRLIVDNGTCVDSSKTVTITVNKVPVANAGSDFKIIEGQSVLLQGTGAGDNITSIGWSPATYLSDASSLTPLATPKVTTTYTLTVVSQSCGIATSTVTVMVYKKLVIPNAFSPNNDGVNDTWNINALGAYPQSRVDIFSRYGQPVYQSTGYAKPWDGTLNGLLLPAGTYYYVIDLKNNTPKLSGWVQLVK